MPNQPNVPPTPRQRLEAEWQKWTVTGALDFAAKGKVADGYACLVWGLHRAEEMVEEGEPWGEELLDRWRLAVEKDTWPQSPIPQAQEPTWSPPGPNPDE